jgi:hypothetical protein
MANPEFLVGSLPALEDLWEKITNLLVVAFAAGKAS